MKQKIILFLFALVAGFANTPVFCLEALSPEQMRQTVARSGVDIAIGNVETESYHENFSLYNTTPGYTDQYMSLNGIRIMSTLNTGPGDVNDDGSINHLSLDVGLYSNRAMLFAQCPDLHLTTDITVDTVDFYGTNIGGIAVDNYEMTSFHLSLGPHGGSGLDFEMGKRVTIASASYNYNPTSALALSGIIIAGEIEGAPETPGLWLSKGEFLIGKLEKNNPATVDFFLDPTTDPTHPRYNAGYIAMNLPMEGSFRVENIQFGSQNFGAFAVDGLEVERLYIEIPGRGLGKP